MGVFGGLVIGVILWTMFGLGWFASNMADDREARIQAALVDLADCRSERTALDSARSPCLKQAP